MGDAVCFGKDSVAACVVVEDVVLIDTSSDTQSSGNVGVLGDYSNLSDLGVVFK